MPGAVGTAARAINDSGQIVGVFDTGPNEQIPAEGYHGFLDNGGTFSTIDVVPPNVGYTIALGINQSGQVVGIFLNAGRGWQGFLYSGGSATAVDDPVAVTCGGMTATGETPETFPLGINDSGQVTGIFRVGSVAEGVTFSDGTHGTFCERPYTYHSFLSNGGSFTTIDVPGARFTWALGINDQGQVVGGFMDASAKIHGFLPGCQGSATPCITSPSDGARPQSQFVALSGGGRLEILSMCSSTALPSAP